MSYLKRRRRSFTLLELMVAFIIMAVLSAVAIPSLIGVVGNDQTTADNTSAVALADQVYYLANSNSSTTPDYSTITAPGLTSVDTVDFPGFILFTFDDNDTVCVTAPSQGGSSPAVVDISNCGGGGGGGGPIDNGPPTDVVVTFAGLNPYGTPLYNISWNPGTNSDGGAVYQVATSPNLEGFSGGGGAGNTCTTHYISDTSCTLAMEMDPTMPSSFTAQVTEQDNGPGAIGYGPLVTFTPPVPTDLVVAPVGDGSFNVTWTGAYPGDTYNAAVLIDAGGDIYLYCDPANPSELQYSVTSCTITAAQAAGIGNFVVEVGENDATYGSGAAFSDDVSNP